MILHKLFDYKKKMILKFNYGMLNCCTLAVTEGYQIHYFFRLNRLVRPMPIYYVQNVYQKNQLGTRLDERHT